MSIQSVIIEDVSSNRENLRNLLFKYCPDVDIIGEAEGVESGINLLEKASPDLVFLDVRLQDGTGFDLLEKLENRNFEVIFVTAYDEYALKAFQLNAIDFLMKPIDPGLLKKAVDKISVKSDLSKENERLRNLVNNLNQNDHQKRIAIPLEDKTEFIELKDILHCESDNNYTIFHLVNGKSILVSRTLKKYEIALENLGFIRVHNSHIVRIEAIQSISRRDGGFLILKNGKRLSISRNRRDFVFSELMK